MPEPLKTPNNNSAATSVTGVTTVFTASLKAAQEPASDAMAKLIRLAEALGRQAARRELASGSAVAPLPVRG